MNKHLGFFKCFIGIFSSNRVGYVFNKERVFCTTPTGSRVTYPTAIGAFEDYSGLFQAILTKMVFSIFHTFRRAIADFGCVANAAQFHCSSSWSSFIKKLFDYLIVFKGFYWNRNIYIFLILLISLKLQRGRKFTI